MRGAVVYLFNAKRAKEVQHSFSESNGFVFDLIQYSETEKIRFSTISCIVVEWELRDDLLFALMELNSDTRIVFYNEKFISDIDDTAALKGTLETALTSNNYALCKSINELLRFGDILRRRSELQSLPADLQIETTDLCNAKCIMCTHVYDYGSGTDILETGLIDRIKPILPFVKTIILHGNGEPFIVRNIEEYLAQLSTYGIQFVTNTNLSVLSEGILRHLNSDFVELNVSCDGYDKESYESVRCGLCFENFVSNCRIVREKCPNLNMKMNVVVMRKNMEYLDRIAEFAHELGFQEVVFNQLCTDERLENAKEDPYLYRKDYVRAIQAVRTTAKRLNIVVQIPDISVDVDTGCSCDESTQPHFIGVCDWLAGRAFINLQGNLAICCMNQKMIVGNVFNQDIREIWNSEQYVALRKSFFAGEIPLCCAGCDFLVHNRLRFFTMCGNLTFEQLKKKQERGIQL